MNLSLSLYLLAWGLHLLLQRLEGASHGAYFVALCLWSMSLLLEYRKLKYADASIKSYKRHILGYRMLLLTAVPLYYTSAAFADASKVIYATFLGASLSAFLVGSLIGISLETMEIRGYSIHSRANIFYKFRSSLSLALLAISLIASNVIANQYDRSLDVSYLKPSAMGDASKKVISRLEQDVRVGLFFSRESDVLPLVKQYLSHSPKGKLKIEIYDKDFYPTQAETFRVAANGQIVLMQGERRQRFQVGDRLADARRNLRRLDADFLKALLQLSSEKSTIYFTNTHGEMSWDSGPPVRSLQVFEELLRGLNYRSRRLSSLYMDVPEDAKALVIVNPVDGFTREEIDHIRRYLARGGSLFLALDTEFAANRKQSAVRDEFNNFLLELGLDYVPQAIAHDKRYVSAARDNTDRIFIFTNIFANHPAVATVATQAERMTYTLHRTGSFEMLSDASEIWTPLVRSLAGSYRDLNGNFEQDTNEAKMQANLVLAREGRGLGKIVVFADATTLSNTLMNVNANQLVALDAMRWLTGKSEAAGAVETEEDVLIRQEKSRESLVFYSSIILAPILVLLSGLLVNRRSISKGGRI